MSHITIASEEFAVTQDEKVLRCLERLVKVAYSRSVTLNIHVDRANGVMGIAYGSGPVAHSYHDLAHPTTPTFITDIINRIHAI